MQDSGINRTQKLLPKVQKPARYTGGEFGQIIKDPSQGLTRIALCFPDTYEIGMSNLGMRILYGAANNEPGIWCERVFAPWEDMYKEMESAGIPLYGLESGCPLTEFDIIAFMLGYEMCYTTVLSMLRQSGIPLRRADRNSISPLIIAGGTCAYNPAPLYDFIDIFIIGEGEEVNLELYKLHSESKKLGESKSEFLNKAAAIPGVLVSELSQSGLRKTVKKRIVRDFDTSFYPTKTVVPSTEIVHDRVSAEIARGCIRGCRFCQAGYVYRPARERSAETTAMQTIDSLKHTGYDETTLLSLSASDYSGILQACDLLLEYAEPREISISLPSLRADNFSLDLMERVQKTRKSGLTFAPEAGSQRLRDVINKNVTEEDLLRTCEAAFSGGYNSIKLYFMLGLPTETDEDVTAIAELSKKVVSVWRNSAKNKQRPLRLTLSTSYFIPKPHTAFQWEPAIRPDEYLRRVGLLKSALSGQKMITYNYHSPEMSVIEAVLARGDARLGAVLERLANNGARLDAWDDFFRYSAWAEAITECGLTIDEYAYRERDRCEEFPWDITDTGVSRAFLWGEREQAMRGLTTPDCREKCSACGARSLLSGSECRAVCGNTHE